VEPGRRPPSVIETFFRLILGAFFAFDILLATPAVASGLGLNLPEGFQKLEPYALLERGSDLVVSVAHTLEAGAASLELKPREIASTGSNAIVSVYAPMVATPTLGPVDPGEAEPGPTEQGTAATPAPGDPASPSPTQILDASETPAPTIASSAVASPTSTPAYSPTPTATKSTSQTPVVTVPTTSYPSPTPTFTRTKTKTPTSASTYTPSATYAPTKTPTAPPPRPTDTTVPAGTYYVSPSGNDSNPGTLDSPWRTLQKAADTLVAGDTVYVRDGIYARVDLKHSGSPGKYITFQAYPGEHPILNGGSWVGFTDRYATASPLQYFIVDGFEIRNFEQGINLAQSNHFILRNNTLHDNTEMGIQIESSQNGEVAYNIAYDTKEYTGIWIIGSRALDIHHNVAYSNFVNGIGLSHAADHNLIHDNVTYDNSCGWDHRYAGIAIEVDSEDNRVYNNLSYNNCHAGFLTNSPNNQVYHNVFYANEEYQILLGDWSGSTPTDNVFMNNIVFITRTADRAVGYFYTDTGYDPLQNVFDYNLYYYTDGPDKSDMIANLPENLTFSEWQALGQEQNGVLGDPRFVKPDGANFHLNSGSPAIDSGAAVGVSDDFDGQKRPRGAAPDIGAFEYQP
jgi:parallel beta-helix repeat protein